MVDLVEKTAAFREATVEKTPVNNNDVVNKAYADTLTGADLTALTSDVIALNDDVQKLGDINKRWTSLYAVMAVLTFLTISGIYIGATATNQLMFNSSAIFNGSIQAKDNITADFYYGDGSLLSNLPGQIYTNLSWNIGSIPGASNPTRNQSMNDNIFYCFGSSGCADSYIKFNGTTLIIKVT